MRSNCQAVEGICQDAPMELKLQPLTGERWEGSTDLNIDEASSGDVQTYKLIIINVLNPSMRLLVRDQTYERKKINPNILKTPSF